MAVVPTLLSPEVVVSTTVSVARTKPLTSFNSPGVPLVNSGNSFNAAAFQGPCARKSVASCAALKAALFVSSAASLAILEASAVDSLLASAVSNPVPVAFNILRFSPEAKRVSLVSSRALSAALDADSAASAATLANSSTLD